MFPMLRAGVHSSPIRLRYFTALLSVQITDHRRSFCPGTEHFGAAAIISASPFDLMQVRMSLIAFGQHSGMAIAFLRMLWRASSDSTR